jgi:secondary thiamine-phosphate synthase enzyme
MRMAQHTLEVATSGQGLYEITAKVAEWVAGQGMTGGLLTLFLRHTSASLLIQENAAPEVRSDLEDFFRALAPEDIKRYRHTEEGADDMPAHIRGCAAADATLDPGGGGAGRDRHLARHLRLRASPRGPSAHGDAELARRIARYERRPFSLAPDVTSSSLSSRRPVTTSPRARPRP